MIDYKINFMIEIFIKDDCNQCGACISMCPAYIFQKNSMRQVFTQNEQSCITCGHCVAICPTHSVKHSEVKESDTYALNSRILPSPDSLMELMSKRRSNRSFSQKKILDEYLNKILKAASLAPTGRNLQALKYILVTDTKILNNISVSIMKTIQRIANTVNNPKTERQEEIANYLGHIINAYSNNNDVILRNAKALILIYADSLYIADANLAYQNASLMADCLNVGHFYTGFLFQFASANTKYSILNSLGIKGKILAGMALGMPRFKFTRTISRRNPEIIKF